MQSGIIAQQLDRISYLEEQVRQLREAVYPRPESYPWRLNLSKSQAALFVRLTRTEIARHEDLVHTLEQVTNRPANLNLLRVQVTKMRNRLKASDSPYRIENVWGVGYRLMHLEPKP